MVAHLLAPASGVACRLPRPPPAWQRARPTRSPVDSGEELLDHPLALGRRKVGQSQLLQQQPGLQQWGPGRQGARLRGEEGCCGRQGARPDSRWHTTDAHASQDSVISLAKVFRSLPAQQESRETRLHIHHARRPRWARRKSDLRPHPGPHQRAAPAGKAQVVSGGGGREAGREQHVGPNSLNQETACMFLEPMKESRKNPGITAEQTDPLAGAWVRPACLTTPQVSTLRFHPQRGCPHCCCSRSSGDVPSMVPPSHH